MRLDRGLHTETDIHLLWPGKILPQMFIIIAFWTEYILICILNLNRYAGLLKKKRKKNNSIVKRQ